LWTEGVTWKPRLHSAKNAAEFGGWWEKGSGEKPELSVRVSPRGERGSFNEYLFFSSLAKGGKPITSGEEKKR